jgi:hypothetical protein
MSGEKSKRDETEQPKLFNVAPMDERGERKKSLNEHPKLSNIVQMDE